VSRDFEVVCRSRPSVPYRANFLVFMVLKRPEICIFHFSGKPVVSTDYLHDSCPSQRHYVLTEQLYVKQKMSLLVMHLTVNNIAVLLLALKH